MQPPPHADLTGLAISAGAFPIVVCDAIKRHHHASTIGSTVTVDKYRLILRVFHRLKERFDVRVGYFLPGPRQHGHVDRNVDVFHAQRFDEFALVILNAKVNHRPNAVGLELLKSFYSRLSPAESAIAELLKA